MEGLVQRLNEVCEYYRLSIRGFAEKLELNYTTIFNYMKGTKAPSAEFLCKIKSTFVDISADWLLVGEGSMFKEKAQTTEQITRELADAKIKMLVQEGVIDRLTKILSEGREGGESKKAVG